MQWRTHNLTSTSTTSVTQRIPVSLQYHISRHSWPTLKELMSYGTAICQMVYKQPPERGGEQKSDSGCDMMGMENFREIRTYLQNASNKVEWLHYLPVAIAQTVFREGKMMYYQLWMQMYWGVLCQALMCLNIR